MQKKNMNSTPLIIIAHTDLHKRMMHTLLVTWLSLPRCFHAKAVLRGYKIILSVLSYRAFPRQPGDFAW